MFPQDLTLRFNILYDAHYNMFIRKHPLFLPESLLSLFLTEDEQREKSMSHHTVQQLIIEKEQALADLNSVEKSLADLFRRYEKMKEVLEGFRKVRSCEEVFVDLA